jgi:predicted nucleic acid-binding protein
VTLVVDASVVVAALSGSGRHVAWAQGLLTGDDLVAPHSMPVEVANILRRGARSGDITEDTASLAHEDLLAMRVDLYPYALCARRAWELRHNTTAYDAWYVALAELLDAPLATLDGRLVRAPGPRCRFLTFED